MLYIYRPRNSNGARELAEGITLTGVLARRTKGLALRNLVNGDKVVCWGAYVALPNNVSSLNNVPIVTKFQEAQTLSEANVPTVQVSLTKPRAQATRRAVRPHYSLDRFRGLAELPEAEVRSLLTSINAYLTQPLPPAQPVEEWLPRRNNHVGGNDLLSTTPIGAQYYSKKENIVEEYRLHMFNGKSLRAGKKVRRATRPDGRTASHEWIRSYDAGWVIQYDGFKSTKEMRTLASSALKALGLDFAAVDIGKTADGKLLVLECNRAPGLEGNTTATYANAIIKWSKGEVVGDGE